MANIAFSVWFLELRKVPDCISASREVFSFGEVDSTLRNSTEWSDYGMLVNWLLAVNGTALSETGAGSMDYDGSIGAGSMGALVLLLQLLLLALVIFALCCCQGILRACAFETRTIVALQEEKAFSVTVPQKMLAQTREVYALYLNLTTSPVMERSPRYHQNMAFWRDLFPC